MSTQTGRGPTRLRVLASVGLVAGAAALVVWIPARSGIGWSDVGRVVADVRPVLLAGLAGLWLAGLVASSVALAACLPGLRVHRALMLSLGGSAVANVLPLGGAAGVGVNFALARSWGHRTRELAAYTVVTNLFDVTSKVVVVALAGAVVASSGHGSLPGAGLARGALVVAGVVLLGAVLLLRAPAATAVGRRFDVAGVRIGRLLRRPLVLGLETGLPRLAASSLGLLRRAWPRIVAGSGAYALLQALLLAACLHVCGLRASLSLVAALFAVDRLLTLLPVTPGGVGVVETVLSTTVLAWGVPAAPGLAGVLLYRALTYAAEVPVGGAVLLGWTLHRASRRRRRDVPGERAVEAVG